MRFFRSWILVIATGLVLQATALAQPADTLPPSPAQKPAQPMPGLPAHAIDPAGLHAVGDERADLRYGNLTAGQIDGLSVMHDDQVVGEIEAVLADDGNRIVAVAIEYGGYLALDGTTVVVPIERLTLRAEAGHAVVNLSETELKTLPAWEE